MESNNLENQNRDVKMDLKVKVICMLCVEEVELNNLEFFTSLLNGCLLKTDVGNVD